jgi:hypothetical protein
MQNTAWGNVVDEEQDIRNDGSKSSRSHRPFKFSNQLFLASTNAREISPFLRSNSGDGTRVIIREISLSVPTKCAYFAICSKDDYWKIRCRP